nr:uncharacterized protein LOC113820759 isoform X1 [Penaeus vannamei]
MSAPEGDSNALPLSHLFAFTMADSVFTYDAATWSVTQEMKDAYDTNGYILVRNVFSPEEMRKVRAFVEGSDVIQERAYSRDDGKNRRSRVTLWNHPGRDVLGCWREAEGGRTMEEVMGGQEVYHYHSKLDYEGCTHGRQARVAPGLWILVQERLPVSGHGIRIRSDRRLHEGERLLTGPQGVAPPRPLRPREGRRAAGSRAGEGGEGQGAARTPPPRDGLRRRPVLPLQPPAHLRPEHL